MTQNVPLDTGDVADEAFFDATQEMLSGLAVNFALTLVNPTTLRVPAGTGHAQVSLSIQGQYRFVTANVDRAFPGGAAGAYDVFVTSVANGAPTASPPSAPPGNDFSFALAIVAAGGSPVGVDIYRKVGAVTWSGSAITALTQQTGAVAGARLAPGAIAAGSSITATRQPDGSVLLDVADGTIGAPEIANALKPSAGASSATEALRALGTSGSAAAAGNDSRLLPNVKGTTSVGFSLGPGAMISVDLPMPGVTTKWPALAGHGFGEGIGITCCNITFGVITLTLKNLTTGTTISSGGDFINVIAFAP